MKATTIPVAITVLLAYAASRPPDIAFNVRMIDPGYSETVAVADVNKDGKPDIISGESWYESPHWIRHTLRAIDFTSNYIDNFSDLAIDVDGDGWVDVVQAGYFTHNIVWLKNPGRTGGEWKVTEIDNSAPVEFAFLVDLNNDGKALEILPEFDRASAPMAWFELQAGQWIKHVVAQQSFGHGIGVGDINGDGRNDIVRPRGWLEAPPDVRAPGDWKFHPTDWDLHTISAAGPDHNGAAGTSAPAKFGFMYVLDLNGDGRNDILTSMAHDYGLCWYEQMADGAWTQHVIDNTWSQAHASVLADVNGDGQLDLVTGKRYFAHNGTDPGEREPLGLYWYEYRKVSPQAGKASVNGGVEWIRHIVDYGGRMGGGMQIVVHDMNGDGQPDIVTGGKAGLFLAENLTRSTARVPR